MKRLFVVNGLFGFLNCMATSKVADHDEVTVLVLFSSDPHSNAQLEARMRELAPVRKCVFLTDPEEYIARFSDQEFMTGLCRNPGEVRMFFTHNTWLHNRIFAAYPDARIVLYEEGMASYYPGLIEKYDDLPRIEGVYLHNYLDRYVSPDVRKYPDKFGLIDRDKFLNLLSRIAAEPDEQILSSDTVVVVEQYLFKKGRAQELHDAAKEYADAIRLIIGQGYSVAYKRHPRESTQLYERIRTLVGKPYLHQLRELPRSSRLLEETILHQRPAGIAAISSTSLLTVPHYFEVPSYVIRSRAPFDVAKTVPVERRGLTVNQVALTARVPNLSHLPGSLHQNTAMESFRSRFTMLPRLCDDEGIVALGEVDFSSDYVELVRQIADPTIQAVSFDLFDTLVKRPAVAASDVFALLDKQLAEIMPKFVRYSDVRSTVFKRLDAQMRHRGGRPAEYSLSQVYEYIGSVLGLDADQQTSLMAAEINLETELVQLRRAGYALTQVAEAYDKLWAITTDTYFDDTQLQVVGLSKLPSSPHHITSSLRHQKTKAAGDLFEVTASSFGLPRDSILHIGDRWGHDVENAEKAGLRGAWFPSATAAAESHARLADTWQDVREERASALLRGMTLSETFDNPFRDFAEESITGGQPELLGYLAVGPALIGWALWILRTAAAKGVDSLLFLSRDGYLPFEICQRLVEDSAEDQAIPMRYVMSSRRAMFDLFNQDRGHIGYTEFVHGLSPQTTVRTLLTTRFGQKVADELGPTIAAAGPGSMDAKLGKAVDSVKNALAEESATIAELCAGVDRSARDYYREAVGDAKQPAIIDVGYSGSAQRGISLALGRNIAGLYFTTMEHNTEHAAINDLDVAEYTTDPVFFRSGGMLEYLITPPGLESCNGFDANSGAPVFDDLDESDSVRDAVHIGVRQCIEDFFRIFDGHTAQFAMRPRLASHMLATFMSSPGKADANTLVGARHEDTVGGNNRDVFAYWREGRNARRQSARDQSSAASTPDRETAPAQSSATVRELERELIRVRGEVEDLRTRTAAAEAKALATRVGRGLERRARKFWTRA